MKNRVCNFTLDQNGIKKKRVCNFTLDLNEIKKKTHVQFYTRSKWNIKKNASTILHS
jgi:hypothetical protein